MKRFFYMMKQCRRENFIYLVVWGLVFLAPLLTSYAAMASDSYFVFEWEYVFSVWRMLAVYFFLFLVHNFLLVPLLFNKRRIVLYFCVTVLLVGSFSVYQYNHKPEKKRKMPRKEQAPAPHSGHMKPDAPQGPMPPIMHDKHLMPGPPPPVVNQRNFLAIAVLVLIFGVNFGIKAYFRSREDRRRLAELEKQNLEHQLEYLRCQINPHFFMNTLNNIHALVDVDPEQAKWAIREFSKMMRYVLYEGDRHGVPLVNELDFVRQYISLMQLRYTSKVRISADIPRKVPNSLIPPMILITFVENAFKHGISYQCDSFVDVKVAVDENVLEFCCRNSKAAASTADKTGVGLANVRKRLDLLYDSRYRLFICDDSDTYNVELVIPLEQ